MNKQTMFARLIIFRYGVILLSSIFVTIHLVGCMTPWRGRYFFVASPTELPEKDQKPDSI
ncbi:hypothetical protein JZK55_11340 [Dissulfurispira thermophila]|uniref:Uncharacterized protein n=1 Tax=Dissulfurispira thermophila TaxID=2715679 RepID=A0A7G1H1X5_9BACT|nr:hypothetical protein JZK55_11340 [Dissulfurispira thermophila]